MFAPSLKERPVEVTVQTPETSNWKVATQLQKKNDSVLWAPNLYYFMVSPMEISNHSRREFQIIENEKIKNVRFVLHHVGTAEVRYRNIVYTFLGVNLRLKSNDHAL